MGRQADSQLPDIRELAEVGGCATRGGATIRCSAMLKDRHHRWHGRLHEVRHSRRGSKAGTSRNGNESRWRLLSSTRRFFCWSLGRGAFAQRRSRRGIATRGRGAAQGTCRVCRQQPAGRRAVGICPGRAAAAWRGRDRGRAVSPTWADMDGLTTTAILKRKGAGWRVVEWARSAPPTHDLRPLPGVDCDPCRP